MLATNLTRERTKTGLHLQQAGAAQLVADYVVTMARPPSVTRRGTMITMTEADIGLSGTHEEGTAVPRNKLHGWALKPVRWQWRFRIC